MENIQRSEPPKPILTRAAENGLYLNMYISVLVLAVGFGATYPVATLLVWCGSLAMPFFVYRMLRRSQTLADGSLSFAELWAEGIASFMLGTLIPALIAYISLRFVVPTFMHDSIAQAIAMLEEQSTANAVQVAEAMKSLLKMRMPTPVDVASQIISFNIIIGTTMSLIVAAIVKARTPRKAVQTPGNQ